MKNVALVIALSTLGFACNRTIDSAELENKIKADGTSKGWPLKSVECPKSQPFKMGDKFDCTTTFEDGKTTTTTVEQKDDKGNIEWTTKNLVAVSEIADAISKNNHGVAVKCPAAKWMIGKEGDKFECTAAAEKASWEVTLGKDGKYEALPKK